MKYLTSLLIVLMCLQSSCSQSKQEVEATKKFAEMEANGIAKVKIDERGDIYLNNKLTSLDVLSDEFARIKKVNGVVWYYRVSESSAAAASSKSVMQKVVQYRLPVKMCASNDPCRKAFE